MYTKKKSINYLWEIIHRCLATDSYTYTETTVEGENQEDAMNFFNKYVADGTYILPIDNINNVYPFKYIAKGEQLKKSEKR